MTGGTEPDVCPKCGCALLWNGRVTACISCPYTLKEARSEKKIPAAKSKKRNRRTGGAGRL